MVSCMDKEATIEIKCSEDYFSASVVVDRDPLLREKYPTEGNKAELVAKIMLMRCNDLLSKSIGELQQEYLNHLRFGR